MLFLDIPHPMDVPWLVVDWYHGDNQRRWWMLRCDQTPKTMVNDGTRARSSLEQYDIQDKEILQVFVSFPRASLVCGVHCGGWKVSISIFGARN